MRASLASQATENPPVGLVPRKTATPKYFLKSAAGAGLPSFSHKAFHPASSLMIDCSGFSTGQNEPVHSMRIFSFFVFFAEEFAAKAGESRAIASNKPIRPGADRFIAGYRPAFPGL